MDEIRRLEGQLRREHLTRREFMGRASAFGLTLASASVLSDRAREGRVQPELAESGERDRPR